MAGLTERVEVAIVARIMAKRLIAVDYIILVPSILQSFRSVQSSLERWYESFI